MGSTDADGRRARDGEGAARATELEGPQSGQAAGTPGAVERYAIENGAPVGEELVRLQRIIERAVARVCPHWLAPMREDIVQDSMVRLAQVLEREGGRSPSFKYLQRVAYSAVVTEIHRARRRQEISLADDVAEHAPAPEIRGHPSRRSHAREIVVGLSECLADLSPTRRTAVQLFLYGYSIAESAELLGLATKRLENLRYRGLADLRSCLSGKGLQP